MKTCKYCSAEMADEDLFCPQCGKSQDDSAQEEKAEMVTEEATQEAVSETAPAEDATPEEIPEEAASAEIPAAEASEETPAEEPAEPQKAKVTPGKLALAIAAVVILVAALIALIVAGTQSAKPEQTLPSDGSALESGETAETEETEPPTIPEDGNPDDATCKGTYTAEDDAVKAARDTVVATVGDGELTNAILQICYWREVYMFQTQYGGYAPYFGLDFSQSLDTQKSMEGDMTWQQYFLQCALSSWQQIQAMAAESRKAGLTIGEESQKLLDELKDTLTKNAESYGMTLEEMLLKEFGPGMEFADYEKFLTDYYQGLEFFSAETEKLKPTEKDLETFYTEHEEQYKEQNITKDSLLVDVRHILLAPEGGTTDDSGNTTYSDEEWEACRVKAQEILDGWLAGDKTEESFADLANQHSTDPGSNQNGGLYEGVEQGQMVAEFDEWCFDGTRAPGDWGLVKTPFGYHIMYYVGNAPKWKVCAESDWLQTETNNLLDRILEKYPLEVQYENILLGSTAAE